MESKNTQDSIPVFEIKIKDYEMDMETSKNKKNEILDLFTNHNQEKLKSQQILIYKQLKVMHFHFQLSKKFIFKLTQPESAIIVFFSKPRLISSLFTTFSVHCSKLNCIHLHLNDDQGWRIEIKKYPKLTSCGSVSSEWAIESINVLIESIDEMFHSHTENLLALWM